MISRLEKVRKMLRREKADALLMWNSEGNGQPATRWLSGFTPTPKARKHLVWGFTGTASVLLVTKEKQFLITDGRYTAQAKKEAKGFAVFISSAQKPTLQILSEIIRKNNVRRILFDGSVTVYALVEELKSSVASEGDTSFRKGGTKILPVELISRKHILQELRVVKEKGEIQLLKKSADIACLAFSRLLPEIHAGMTEKGIAKRLEDLMAEEGGEGIAFPTIVASGKNGAHPHARASDKKIKDGELVTIDFGARYQGYVSDMTRTIAVGRVSPRLKNIYEAVQKAQELGCEKAKAGVTGAEIDAVCRNYLTKKGFGKYFTHSTGHGIGMEVHELPHISPIPPPACAEASAGRQSSLFRQRRIRPSAEKRGRGLPAGAVITCEPGVYIPSVGGVRIEDSLVLTKKGNINLSAGISKELLIL